MAEVEDLLRTTPPRARIYESLTEEDIAWLGRASAVVENWSSSKAIALEHLYLPMIYGGTITRPGGYDRLMTLLHQARHDLRMQTLGPMNVAVSGGMVFEYFDEIRKIIEVAKRDLFFVDPYLDAEFVSRYLSHVTSGVTTRLLTRERLATLLPAVDAFARQTGMKIEIRVAPGFHDRYIFVDKTACYQSGASFKDGAKSAPTTLTQITDAFDPVLQTYETMWNGARVER